MRAARHGFGVRSTASSAQARRTWSCHSVVADPRRPRLSVSPKSQRAVSEVNPNYRLALKRARLLACGGRTSEENAMYQSVNPYNNEVLGKFDNHSDSEMLAALSNAHGAFRDRWSGESYKYRSEIVGSAATLMEARIEELSRLATLEMGKRIQESRDEVRLSAAILKFYAQNAERFLAGQQLKSAAFDAWTEYAPIGVLLGIQPWNYPYYQLARFAAPNLMAGNTLLVKHAPGVPQCALAFEKIFRDAGAPTGTYANVFLSNEQVSMLIDDPRIQGVALTGSERAGEVLASRAGKNLKKSTMELGGSDAFIVLEDCDLAYAVKMAVAGRIGNCGQTCIGAKRFIVVGERFDEFVEAFRAKLAQLKPGDPLDEKTNLGPMSSETAMSLLLDQIRDAVTHGAKLVTGGKRLGQRGAFVEPTILTEVTPKNPAHRQEFFGPAAIVYSAKDDTEAVAIANDSPFGLGGSIYTPDISRGRRLASRIESGMVFINYPSVSSPELPFGGIKRSGYGKELSEDGILEFVNKKLICTPRTTIAERAPQLVA
jgi:succinate-semialdehyde dehydrogenase / glutarate-semialdehyde dehydrogenase